MQELDAILAHRDHIVAVDLAGDEPNFPAGWFRDHFRRVRDAGLHVTIHAGEAAGPHSVWAAIRDLGAERIGHGFRAIEDPVLVDYLAEKGIGLECCPTRFCLNTDDPGISNIDIAHEYEVAAPAIGLTVEQVRQAQADALDMAFLSAADKADLPKPG
jgi:adenosine deaminase